MKEKKKNNDNNMASARQWNYTWLKFELTGAQITAGASFFHSRRLHCKLNLSLHMKIIMKVFEGHLPSADIKRP
jgi:hypothetical protein